MIVLTDLQKVIDQTTVIDIPMLEVKAGGIAAGLGQVDSGKNVMFQLLTGNIHPTNGNVRLSGVNPYHEREAFRRQVGVLFAEDNLYKRLSVIENLHAQNTSGY